MRSRLNLRALGIVLVALTTVSCVPVSPSPSPAPSPAPSPTIATLVVYQGWEAWCFSKKGCSLILDGPDGASWAVGRSGGSAFYTVLHGGIPRTVQPGAYKLSFSGARSESVTNGGPPGTVEIDMQCSAEFEVRPADAEILLTIKRDDRGCSIEIAGTVAMTSRDIPAR